MSLFGPKWSSKRMAVRENLISKYMLVNLSFCSPRPYIFSFAAYTRQKCCSSKNTRTVEFSYKSSPAFNFEPAFFILFEAHLVGISHPSITHLRWIESLQLDVRRRLKGWKPFVYHKTILRFRINCWCRLMRNSCWYFNNNYDSPVSSFSSQCLWTRWERFCEYSILVLIATSIFKNALMKRFPFKCFIFLLASWIDVKCSFLIMQARSRKLSLGGCELNFFGGTLRIVRVLPSIRVLEEIRKKKNWILKTDAKGRLQILKCICSSE